MAWRYRAQFGSEGTGDGQFQQPVGVVISADGRTAWLADLLNQRISVWTRLTSTSTEWSHSINFGSQGTGDTNFDFPYGVAVSADTLTAWVADSNNHRISVWTRPTSTLTDWSHSTNFGSEGTSNPNFRSPHGVAVSANGRTAWVADSFNNRISVWTRSTENSTDWSPSYTFGSQGTDDANFKNPFGVAVSVDERTAWVADSHNHRISVWTRPTSTSTEWSPSTTFGSGPGSGDANFKYPSGVALSADGRTVWVADTNNSRVSVWTRATGSSTDWSHSISFGSEGNGDANFGFPTGVAVSANSRTVWVANRTNHRISIWTYS